MSTTCSDNKYEHLNCDMPDFQGKSFTRPAPKCCAINENHCSKDKDGKTYISCKPEAFSCLESYAPECSNKSIVWYAQPSSNPDSTKPVAAYLHSDLNIYQPVNNLTCCPGNYVYKLGPWKANSSTI